MEGSEGAERKEGMEGERGRSMETEEGRWKVKSGTHHVTQRPRCSPALVLGWGTTCHSWGSWQCTQTLQKCYDTAAQRSELC